MIFGQKLKQVNDRKTVNVFVFRGKTHLLCFVEIGLWHNVGQVATVFFFSGLLSFLQPAINSINRKHKILIVFICMFLF